ncbi:DUF1254 domain-containing protein [Hoeflea sp.]|uniref:DUF1254 domain-containing protein n=1 Tax=Hoeflea sp. TaxID=1940281 RepID=UPI003B520CA6
MRSLLLAILIGLVGAALIHIIAILEMPRRTGTDAWSRVQALGAQNRFFPLANVPNATGLYNEDPHIRTAVCRFDISERPVRILTSGDVPLWTVVAYDTASNETYSMNDRSSIGVNVDVVFVSPAQMLRLRRFMPETLERAVLVQLDDPEGFVALRAIAPTPSQEPAARAFVAGASCAPLSIDPA